MFCSHISCVHERETRSHKEIEEIMTVDCFFRKVVHEKTDDDETTKGIECNNTGRWIKGSHRVTKSLFTF